MNRNLLSNLSTAVLVVCAVLVTAAVVKREFLAPPAAASSIPAPRRVAGARELAQGAQLIGAADAPVRIVASSDFQCPFCAEFHQRLRRVSARHPGRVAVAYRHLPLDAIHPHARAAGLAAECAGEQGRFESFADVLFAQQDTIGRKPWTHFAAGAQVPDARSFERCIAERRWAGRVDDDARLAARMEIRVTPSVIINNTLLAGVMSEADLERWIMDPATVPSAR